MCDEYRLSLHDTVGLGDGAEQVFPSLQAHSPDNDIAIRPSALAPLLVPKDPQAPDAGLRWILARWWLVPSFHHGSVSEWRAVSAHARLESLETRYAYLEPYQQRRGLAPFSSFVVYSAGQTRGQRDSARGSIVRWNMSGPEDTVRFFPAVWDVTVPADETEDLYSFAIVVGQPARDYQVACEAGATTRKQPRLLTRAQALEWLRLDGPGKLALIDPRPAGGFDIREWTRTTGPTD